MPRLIQYRVQRAEFRGIVNRGWGFGRAASWGPWRTVFTGTEVEATAYFERWSRKGLARWRIVHGKQELRRSN